MGNLISSRLQAAAVIPAMDVAASAAPRPRRKPESEATKARRLQNLAVRLADREHRAKTALAALTGGLPRARGHVTRLEDIEDESKRLEVMRARVERLEALLDSTERKRETRAKIVLGATLLSEARREPGDPLLERLVEILDRAVDRPRDRQALAETLGLPITPLRGRAAPALPDFDAMVDEALVQVDETPNRPGRKKGE